MAAAVFAHVFEFEARGQVEIELHGGELPRAADRVDQLDVDFRSVECGFAGDALEWDLHARHGFGERVGSAMPVFGLAGVIFRMRLVPIGKLDLELLEAKIFHHSEGEVDASFDFTFDLRRHAENVRVVLSETAHAQEAVEHAAAFVAIHGAEFGEAHGQIAIAAQPRLINKDVARAIHRLELVFGFFDFHGAEHVVFVKAGVAAGVPEFAAHDVRRVNDVVSALEKFGAQPVLDDRADQTTFGVPENQAGAGFVLDAEEIEFGAELAMIATLRFFETMQIGVEFFLCEKARGVNALKLRIPFVAFPVGAGDAHQFERLNTFGRWNVRAAAEVDEFAGGVKRDHRVGGFFFDELALKNLVGFFVELDGFRLGDEFALVLQILGGELVHFLFDFLEIFGSERLIAEKFVKESGVDRRANAEFYVGIKLHHRGGEKMRGGVAKDVERIGIFLGQDLQPDVFIERAAQIDQFAGAIALVAAVSA